jgi:hypothetical protein
MSCSLVVDILVLEEMAASIDKIQLKVENAEIVFT